MKIRSRLSEAAARQPDLTQHQQYSMSRDKNAAEYRVFHDLVNHPTNPLRRADLEKMIAKNPDKYSKFSGWLDKLK